MNRIGIFFALFVFYIVPVSQCEGTDRIEDALARCDRAIARFASFDEAEKAAAAIRDLGVQQNDPELEARGLIRMVFVDLYFAQWFNRPAWRERAVELVRNLPESSLAKAEVRMFTGFIEAYYGKDHAGGIAALHEAAAVASSLENDRMLSLVYLFLGQVLPYQGQPGYATECLNRSASFARNGGLVNREYAALKMLLDEESFDPAIESISKNKIARISELAKILKIETVWNLKEPERVAFDIQLVDETYALIQTNNLNNSPLQEINCLLSVRRLITHFQKSGQWEDSVRYMDIADHICARLQDESTHMAIYTQRAYYHAQKGEFEEVERILPRLISCRKKQMRFGDLSFVFRELARYAFLCDNRELAANWSGRSSEFLSAYRHTSQATMASDNFVNNTLNSRQIQNDLRAELLVRDRSIVRQNFWITMFCVLTPLLFTGSWIWNHSRKMRAEKNRLSVLVHQQTESLRTAKKNAEKANRAKTDFLARVNHELRNPLTALVCNCELIELEENKSPAMQTATETIQACTQSLLDVIEDVLDFTRIESGQLTLNEARFSPGDLAQTVESIVGGHLNRHVELEFHFDPDIPDRVFGDEAKLRQVLVNLGMNAARHTEFGIINFDWHWDQPRSRLTIVTSDTGCGIPEDQHETIFNQYATDTTKPGRGLGLFISKAFIERMGGELSLDSVVGLGSRFKIELPLDVVDSNTAPAVKGFSPGNRITRILVIDDEEMNLSSIESLLNSQQEYCIFTAGNLQNAERILKQERIDTVFVDLRMPIHDGFEVAGRIKDMGLKPAPMLVAMTGDATEFTRAKTERFGFNGFLAKPFTLRSMKQTLERIENRISTAGDPRTADTDVTLSTGFRTEKPAK